MNKPIALVDMDGTVADYEAAVTRDLALLRSPEETGPLTYHGVSEEEPEFYRARVRLIRNRAGWWKNLGCLEDGFRVVDMLKRIGFTIRVLTKGPRTSTNAWSEKVCWCKNHLPDVPVTITSNKEMVYGRVLVDDWPPYVEPWLKARPRGLVIMPDRPWNQGFEHPNVVRLRGDNDDEVFSALKRAHSRKAGEP